MKNFLLYFYKINVENIFQINKNMYRIKHNNNYYIIEKFENNLENIQKIESAYNISINLKNKLINSFMLNIDNQIMTYYDKEIYILLKVTNNYNKKIKLIDIINYDQKIISNVLSKQNNWKELWCKKIDYFEYQVNQFGLKYPIIRESFSYFDGTSETAIQLLNEIENNDLYISHRRLTYNSTYYDLYNPFNLILDSRVRDIATYIKTGIYKNKIKISEMISFLNEPILTQNEKILLFIRMIYPSEYYDIYEKIISSEVDESILKKYIENINKYETILKELNKYLNFNIEWLKN